MKRGDKLFWIWLSEALGAASRDFRRLIGLYDQPYDLFHAEEYELERIEDLTQRTITALSDKNLHHATEILDTCERLGIGILPYGDEAYPRALRELDRPPILLYYKGELPDFNSMLCIGMVGTRRMSAYGLRAAYKISYELASVGAVVVSGMAAGIDGVCAASALAANGKTVAVLGCGLDVVYPRHHKTLMDEICKRGALLSEYPPGTRPNHYHFPIRNRIISGLSQGTVVVEAGIGSGSLITAKDAIMQGRDVFALPANVGSQGAEGTNGLLRDGANLVLNTADILQHYEFIFSAALQMSQLEEAQQHSVADLAYLSRMGVIELTNQADRTPPVRAVAEEPGKAPRSAKLGRSAPKRKRTVADEKPTERDQTAFPQENAKDKSASESKTPDAILSSLTPMQRAILEVIPDDRAVTVDSLGALGYPYGDMIAAITMLEILGLIQKLPGALYTKS